MKKVYIMVSILMLSLFLSSCIIKPVRDDTAVATAKDGTEFTVCRIEDDFPDQEISIFVSVDGKEVFSCYNIGSYVSKYNYSNDLVENYAQIIGEYKQDKITAYEFNWGIIYTLDNGISFTGVPKHDYELFLSQSTDFQMIYNALRT